MAFGFDPADREQRRFTGWGPAPIPYVRDQVIDDYVAGLRSGGPIAVRGAIQHASEFGRRVLLTYAQRAAARAVRERSPDLLVSALVAVVVGGLDHNALEALIRMALVEDACRRIGADVDDFFGRASATATCPDILAVLGGPTRWATRGVPVREQQPDHVLRP